MALPVLRRNHAVEQRDQSARVQLPADVEADQVTAALSDGVLTVRAPKVATARRRRIPISS